MCAAVTIALSACAAGAVGAAAPPAAPVARAQVSAVTFFYRDLALRDYRAAYALYAPAVQRATSYANWVAGYSGTSGVRLVQAVPTPGAGTAVSVYVEATADGRRQAFLGAWQLALVHGAWRLAQAQIWAVPGAQRVTCLMGQCPAAQWSLSPALSPGAATTLTVTGDQLGGARLQAQFSPSTGQTWTLRPVSATAASGPVRMPVTDGMCQGCAGHPHVFGPGLYGFFVTEARAPAWSAEVQVALVRFPPAQGGGSGATTASAAGSPLQLAAIAAPDPSHLWLGGAGIILASSDAGRTWHRQYAGKDTIAAFDFLDAQDGWAVGTHALLRTTDGGAAWARAGEPASPLTAVDFADADRGWGVAGGRLYRTTDGGRTWLHLPTPAAVGGTCLLNARRGWITNPATAPTSIYATADGGSRWTRLGLPAGLPPAGGPGGWTQQIGCIGSGTLWDLMVFDGYAGGVGYAVYRSTDGGARWQTAVPVSGPGPLLGIKVPGALAAVSAQNAYLSGACGACDLDGTSSVAFTSNGGRTWAQVAVPGAPFATTGLAFPDARTGWLLATWPSGTRWRSAVWGTGDGGRTWSPVTLAGVPAPAAAP